MTIEAVVYNDWSSDNPNLHYPRSFEGYCENIPKGAVRVELWVGPCPVVNPWVMLTQDGNQFPE